MSSGKAGASSVPYYSPKQIGQRCAEILEIFDDLKRTYEKLLAGVTLHIDEERLHMAVTAYFHDVCRYKWWHYRATKPRQERLNGSKKAAFLCYWLNKIAPVSVERTTPASHALDPVTKLPLDMSLIANTHFALHAAQVYFGYKLSQRTLSALIYQLHWRDATVKTLLLIFDVFEMLAGGEKMLQAKMQPAMPAGGQSVP